MKEKKIKQFMNKVKHLESKIIAIDFDGVIHKNSKGFHDGTVYDELMDGAYESIVSLSEQYSIVIFSCKALKDRPLINGKSGIELIWDWLEEKGLRNYVDDVTDTKPRAIFYIDDKGIRFENWTQTMRFINDTK